MEAIPTTLVDVSGMSRWIESEGIEQILVGLAREIEKDYRRWHLFHKIPRVATHTPIGVIELMPTSDGEEYSFKYVNGHPDNPARGFQTVTAFGVLADVDNGYPTFIAEMTILTAMRTAAVSALVANWLARPGSRVMAMIGTGSQAEFQALAMRALVGIDTLRIHDVDPAAMAKLRANLEPLGFTIIDCVSAADAAHGADVVTTCTADKALAQVLHSVDIAPGTHINGIGGDCPGKTELSRELLQMGPVFVEFEEQTRIEGDIQQMPADFPVTEIWRVFTGQAPGRRFDDEVTIFDSVGFALNDFSALRFVRDSIRASERGSDFTQDIEIVADPRDPKDLFSLVASPLPVG